MKLTILVVVFLESLVAQPGGYHGGGGLHGGGGQYPGHYPGGGGHYPGGGGHYPGGGGRRGCRCKRYCSRYERYSGRCRGGYNPWRRLVRCCPQYGPYGY